jgi:hypothetical protein
MERTTTTARMVKQNCAVRPVTTMVRGADPVDPTSSNKDRRGWKDSRTRRRLVASKPASLISRTIAAKTRISTTAAIPPTAKDLR